ncbi:hypothetical protein LIA77_05053 [Sarocladium implicatum]|nr:hypothetical protein LIA77_05053 [Sarocladium implicatum]
MHAPYSTAWCSLLWKAGLDFHVTPARRGLENAINCRWHLNGANLGQATVHRKSWQATKVGSCGEARVQGCSKHSSADIFPRFTVMESAASLLTEGLHLAPSWPNADARKVGYNSRACLQPRICKRSGQAIHEELRPACSMPFLHW